MARHDIGRLHSCEQFVLQVLSIVYLLFLSLIFSENNRSYSTGQRVGAIMAISFIAIFLTAFAGLGIYASVSLKDDAVKAMSGFNLVRVSCVPTF